MKIRRRIQQDNKKCFQENITKLHKSIDYYSSVVESEKKRELNSF